jgi:hypothetical protein
MKILAMTAAILFTASGALAAETDTIDTVSSDGETIIMQSGQTYRSYDPGTSATWTPGDDVVITGSGKIINKDSGGESVDSDPE